MDHITNNNIILFEMEMYIKQINDLKSKHGIEIKRLKEKHDLEISHYENQVQHYQLTASDDSNLADNELLKQNEELSKALEDSKNEYEKVLKDCNK